MTEASLLAEAISALRRQNDPRAALALLDRHARGYPHARLGSEAVRTRVEALVRLGDLETTLTLLDGMSDAAASLGADLNAYQQRFPSGRFAPEVRRLLAGEISSPQP